MFESPAEPAARLCMSIDRSTPSRRAASFWWSPTRARAGSTSLPPLASMRVLCIDQPELSWLLNHGCGAVTIACTSSQAATEAGQGGRICSSASLGALEGPITSIHSGIGDAPDSTDS